MTDIEHADRPDQFSAVHRMVGGVRVVTVEGEIDHTVRELLSSALLSGCGAEPPSRIVVDLSGVTFMDSSGINVLIAASQQVAGAQGWLRIAGAQGPVLRVLAMVGVDALIPCHPTVEQALNA
ncbi:STAS domain-containing protein [Streptomyces canus]|uniref:STAS domain-containing protein n=1 Tax=Streptomyces canus TaxID=58343 RepID=UPI0036A6394C